MRTRKWTNGNWDSRSSSDAALRRAVGGCASMHDLVSQRTTTVRRAQARERRRDAEQRRTRCAPPRVIDPEVERRKIKVPKIKSHERRDRAAVRLAVDRGFRHQPGLRAAPPPTTSPKTFLPGRIRPLHGRAHQLRDPGRQYPAAYALLRDTSRITTCLWATTSSLARSFSVARLAMTSAFYLIGGIGSTEFAGDSKFTVNFGGGYRVLPTDWLAIHIEVAGSRVPVGPAGRRQAHEQHRSDASARPSSFEERTDHETSHCRTRRAARRAARCCPRRSHPNRPAPQFTLDAQGGQPRRASRSTRARS